MTTYVCRGIPGGGVMDEYIKRSDALKVIETANSMASSLLEATMKLCVTMDRISAADVAPVRNGKWIVDSIADNIYRCNKCGNDAPVDPTSAAEYKSNYCPNCGAKMGA